MAHLSTYLFYRRLEGLIVSALLRLMASVRLRSSSSRDLARLVPSLAVVRAAVAGRAVHGFAGNALSLSTYGPLESRLVSVLSLVRSPPQLACTHHGAHPSPTRLRSDCTQMLLFSCALVEL